MKNKLHNLKIICAFISFVYSAATYSAVSSTVTIKKNGFNQMGDVTGTVMGPPPSNSNDYSNTGGGDHEGAAFIITNNPYEPSSCDLEPSQLTQKSSDGVATGILIAPDIIVGLTGTASGDYTPYQDANYTVVTVTGIWESNGTFNSSAANTAPGYTWCGGASTTTNNVRIFWKKGHQYSSSFTGSWFVYIGPNAKKGTYPLKKISLGRGQFNNGVATTLINAGNITYTPPIQCTINTPPKIDFGKVNIWDWEGNTSGTPGGNRKDVLGVVDGNFMINCTGDNGAHAPAKLTLNGTIYSVTNNLKMTMDATGELAPATVRASIKTIHDACATKGTNFGPGSNTPPANQVDLGDLTIGSHQIPYRFSLCSLGEGVKFGAASATATVTLDWE